MFKMPKPEFTPEFRELTVKRVKSGMTIGAVAKELGLVEQTLRISVIVVKPTSDDDEFAVVGAIDKAVLVVDAA